MIISWSEYIALKNSKHYIFGIFKSWCIWCNEDIFLFIWFNIPAGEVSDGLSGFVFYNINWKFVFLSTFWVIETFLHTLGLNVQLIGGCGFKKYRYNMGKYDNV